MMFISMRIDNPAQVLRKEEGCLFAIKPVLWLSHPVRIGYGFFFFFGFSYGDYSFGRALKTTVGRGEEAGLKDRINRGSVAVDKRRGNRETEVFSCSGNIPFLRCLLFLFMAEGQVKQSIALKRASCPGYIVPD